MSPHREDKTPIGYVRQDLSDSASGIISMCVCYLMASLAFIYLFRYLLESMAGEMTVCSIVGASRADIAVMTFWEGSILSCAATLVGILIHWCLTPVFFSRISASSAAAYTIGDYSLIFLIMFGISIFIMMIFTLKYARKTPIEARRYRV